MKLVVGGVYQGKLDMVKRKYNLSNSDCFSCDDNIDMSKKVLYNFEKFILMLMEKELDPCGYMEKNMYKFEDKIIIMNDIFCGIVPMDLKQRQWREYSGKVSAKLSANADEVIRVFCGIPTKLK